MGFDRTKALALVLLFGVQPALAQVPGWSYSPLPGEGDRASLGCARDSSAENYTCLAVRCEDDYTTGIHLHTSRPGGAIGTWDMTLDREDRTVEAVGSDAPYAARINDPEGWLLDRLRQGTFAYLRHREDAEDAFSYISLSGSLAAITEALHWCAPRVPAGEQNTGPSVLPATDDGEVP